MVRKVFEIRVFKVVYATVAWSGLRGLKQLWKNTFLFCRIDQFHCEAKSYSRKIWTQNSHESEYDHPLPKCEL